MILENILYIVFSNEIPRKLDGLFIDPDLCNGTIILSDQLLGNSPEFMILLKMSQRVGTIICDVFL